MLQWFQGSLFDDDGDAIACVAILVKGRPSIQIVISTAMEYQVPSSDLSPSYPPTTDTVRTDLNGLSGERGKQTRPPPSSHRRRSSGKMPGILKRAVSSPNLGSLGPGADTSMGGDKKRNKLGYHRTAVACGQSPLPSYIVQRRYR